MVSTPDEEAQLSSHPEEESPSYPTPKRTPTREPWHSHLATFNPLSHLLQARLPSKLRQQHAYAHILPRSSLTDLDPDPDPKSDSTYPSRSSTIFTFIRNNPLLTAALILSLLFASTFIALAFVGHRIPGLRRGGGGGGPRDARARGTPVPTPTNMPMPTTMPTPMTAEVQVIAQVSVIAQALSQASQGSQVSQAPAQAPQVQAPAQAPARSQAQAQAHAHTGTDTDTDTGIDTGIDTTATGTPAEIYNGDGNREWFGGLGGDGKNGPGKGQRDWAGGKPAVDGRVARCGELCYRAGGDQRQRWNCYYEHCVCKEGCPQEAWVG